MKARLEVNDPAFEFEKVGGHLLVMIDLSNHP
jgi:hypothetical protein